LADTAFTYDEGSRLVLRRVNVTFYTSQGLKDGVMTSQSGLYNSRLSRLEAKGDVVVVRNDGKRLTTPQLVYDQARNQFFTDTSFVLNEPERTFTGVGFESDPRMTNFRCLRACKVIAPVQIPVK
jgi:LPS export ABC transporter protein LptC